MQEILDFYHQPGFHLNPPASQEAIDAAQQETACRFPEEILALYTDHDGMRSSDAWLSMRFMPLQDVLFDYHAIVREFGWDALGIRIFWTDDSSNNAGLYVEGPLKGKVCWIDHEEVDMSPVYASVASFLRAQRDVYPEEVDWCEFPCDYPALQPTLPPEIVAQDVRILPELYEKYRASEGDTRIHYAYCIMALTPYDRIDAVAAFTDDPDSYIQARACDLLGQRRYEPAIDRLAEVAVSGAFPNAPGAAIQALGRIGSEAARNRLQELLTILPKQHSEIQRALRQHHS